MIEGSSILKRISNDYKMLSARPPSLVLLRVFINILTSGYSVELVFDVEKDSSNDGS